MEDRKYIKTVDYQGTRELLSQTGFTDRFGLDNSELVITLIKLVACSSNGNQIDSAYPKWYYIPRDADRIEALGYVGIKRAKDTTTHFAKLAGIDPVFYTSETKRCKTKRELDIIATPERFLEYQNTGKSASMIDHFYDKNAGFFIAKFDGGIPIAAASPHESILRAALSCPYLWDFNFDWKTQCRSKGNISYVYPLISLLFAKHVNFVSKKG